MRNTVSGMTPLTAAVTRTADLPEVPGVIVRTRGATSRSCAAGVADRRTGEPRRVDEHVRIGSTTKTFTAVVALQLVAEGALELDADLPDLPDVPALSTPPGPPVSLRQLLDHTSGLANYVLDEQFLSKRQGEAMLAHRFDRFTPAELIAVAAGHPRLAEPGSAFSYAGTNYCLIGRHVERATGRSLADEITRRITGPLGLTGTSLPDTETTLPEPHARLYSNLYVPGGPQHDLTEQDTTNLWAGGAMVSTLDDLLTFFDALLGGTLLPPDVADRMFTTVSTHGSGWLPNTRYGLGVYAQELPGGTTVWGHAGNVHGSWTVVMGTRDGRHLMAAHLNTDAVEPDVIVDLLAAEFEPGAAA